MFIFRHKWIDLLITAPKTTCMMENLDKCIGLRQVIFNATDHLSPHGLPDLPKVNIHKISTELKPT